MSAALMPYARARVASTLTDTAVITRPSVSRSDLGGQTTTWTTVATVAGRWAVLSGREATDAARVAPGADTVVTLPWGTAVAATDRIAVGGRTLDVVLVKTGTAALSVRCLCVGVA